MTLRIAFFGSDCLFSETIVRMLERSDHRVCAVVLPASGLAGIRADLPIQAVVPEEAPMTAYDPHALKVTSPFVGRSILNTAWERGMPMYAVRDLAAEETVGTLKMAGAEVACVVCFPRRIPAELLRVPRRGFLNVHPSLLPDYRGPAPLFWQFHEGERHTGVTVHWMDAEFDTGPIAEQQAVPLADGITEADATALMARVGGRILVEVLDQVAAGEIPYRTQPLGGAYQRWPRDEDFVLSTKWSAQRVYNFMRGAAVWGVPFVLELGGERIRLSDAIGWSAYEVLEEPLIRRNGEVVFQCAPGTVRARVV